MLGLFVCFYIPNVLSMGFRARRSEVPGNIEGIVTAELAYDAAFDGFVAIGSRAEAEAVVRADAGRSAPLRDWKGGPAWDAIGWKPDGQVRGAYWVEVMPYDAGFTVFGIIDLEGDGEIAEFRASPGEKAELVTPSWVY